MGKYIDAEKLIAEIDRLYVEHSSKYENDDVCQVLDYLEDFITSLQQEQPEVDTEYIRKDMVIDAIKLAYGKVSMNPFDCTEAFEELLNKLNEM